VAVAGNWADELTGNLANEVTVVVVEEAGSGADGTLADEVVVKEVGSWADGTLADERRVVAVKEAGTWLDVAEGAGTGMNKRTVEAVEETGEVTLVMCWVGVPPITAYEVHYLLLVYTSLQLFSCSKRFLGQLESSR